MTIHGIVALGPRTWVVVALSDNTTILSGVEVENCDSAGRIVFGPTHIHNEASNFLVAKTRKK